MAVDRLVRRLKEWQSGLADVSIGVGRTTSCRASEGNIQGREIDEVTPRSGQIPPEDRRFGICWGLVDSPSQGFGEKSLKNFPVPPGQFEWPPVHLVDRRMSERSVPVFELNPSLDVNEPPSDDQGRWKWLWHFGYISILRKLGSQRTQDAENFTNQAFVKLCRKRGSVLGKKQPFELPEDLGDMDKEVLKQQLRPFFMRMIFRCFLDENGQGQINEWVAGDLQDVAQQMVPAANEDACDELIRNELEYALKDCLTRLNSSEGEIISLHYFSGKSVRDIGNQLNIPRATLGNRLIKIRGRLKQCLESKGFSLDDVR